MSDLEPRRRNTPPDLKWLLNERASVLGAIQSQDERRSQLEAKQQRLEHQLEIVQRDCQRTGVAIGRLQTNLQALDTAIAMAYSQANPESAGAVQAWAGRYGERGALTAFVKSALQHCAPSMLTMTVLMDMAAKQFGQTFTLPSERRSFRKSVRSALHALHQKGYVEPLHSGQSSEHGQWRWKAPFSSLDELREQAQSQGLTWL
jgi:hypothetical protein